MPGNLFRRKLEQVARERWGSQAILSIPAPKPGVRLKYGPGRWHFGHLRLPPTPDPCPVVMNIHGGFWRSHYSLGHAGHLCQAITETGFATWNIEYRRLGNPGGGWPGTLLDVAAALNYLRELAAPYRLDLDKVIVMGHSAGGHLAAWLAAASCLPPDSLCYPAGLLPVQGAIALAGVLDLRLASDLNLSGGVVRELLGGSPQQVPERYAAASPLEMPLPKIPLVALHGTDDEIVPIEIARRYVNAARNSGAAAELIELPAAHFELIDPQSAAWPFLRAALLRL